GLNRVSPKTIIFSDRELCRSSHPSGTATMSALGQKQTLRGVRSMSALPPKADILDRPNERDRHNGRSPHPLYPFSSLSSQLGAGAGLCPCRTAQCTAHS